MKKLFSLMLAAMLALSLAACGETAGDKPRSFDVGDVQVLVGAGVFSEELEELDADVAFALYHLGDYGLSREDLVEAAVVRSAGATCEEAAVLVFSDEKTSKQAEQAMEDYLEGQIQSNTNYRPNEIPKLENAILENRSGHVILVVAHDVEKAKNVLELN